MERYRELVRDGGSPDLVSLIVTFPELGRAHWRLIDEGHRICKTAVVRNGLMLGQFHPLCDAPAAHNQTFAVNRAPIPLMVIRQMAPHDVLFLEEDPLWLECYRTTLARRGIPVSPLLNRARRMSAGRGRTAPSVTGITASSSAASQPESIVEDAPYVRYARLRELHEMQFPRSDAPLELSFILITQVKELLFRMLYVELDTARSETRKGDLAKACRALARANRVQHVLLASWDTLTGMSPADFVTFREVLGEASGRQSFMYRALELIMGNKDSDSVDYLREFGALHHTIEHELVTPSLYDEVVEYLSRHVDPMNALRCRRAGRAAVSEDIEGAWLHVYREPSKYPAEYMLAEALVELSFQFSQWRATHLLVVERMIGSKPGTGGTDGAQWLRQISEHRFFPELWSVRTRI